MSSAALPANGAVHTPGAHEHPGVGADLTVEEVWHALERASFAVLSYVTPDGAPRSSGVVYRIGNHRLYLAVAPDSWKARHISGAGRVPVTVLVRRGGLLSLFFPIPPGSVSFHASATVHPAGSPQAAQALKSLSQLLPKERQDSGAIIEVTPEGEFLTYGIGVSLGEMINPVAARGRVPVG